MPAQPNRNCRSPAALSLRLAALSHQDGQTMTIELHRNAPDVVNNVTYIDDAESGDERRGRLRFG